MADRRDDERRLRADRRDPETERRIQHPADGYRGSDERGYGGGERLGRDWEERGHRELPRDHGELRFRDPGRDRDVRRYAELDRVRPDRDSGDFDRDDRRASPSGAFYDQRRGHYSLAGLHDMDDLSELRERYSERRRQRDYEPRHGHGPGIENMEPLRTGYGTSMSRHEGGDHELGHGGMLGGTYRAGAPRPVGRGPKGYQRSDDRIREDLCDRLMMSWMDAEDVDIQVRDGEVTLQGTVKSRDEKRAIEALAESVLGVKDVHNTLRVQAQERRAQDQEQTSVQKPGDAPLHS